MAPFLIGGRVGTALIVFLPWHWRSMVYEAERFVPSPPPSLTHREFVLRTFVRAVAAHGWHGLRLIRAASTGKGSGPYEHAVWTAGLAEIEAQGFNPRAVLRRG